MGCSKAHSKQNHPKRDGVAVALLGLWTGAVQQMLRDHALHDLA